MSIRPTFAPRPAARYVLPAPSVFPFVSRFTTVGLVLATVSAALAQAPLLFVVVMTLFVCTSAVWRAGEPALAWCLAYQWLYMSAGYFYWLATGAFPGAYSAARIEEAVLLSHLGLVMITVGIRLAMKIAMPRTKGAPGTQQAGYSMQTLFVVTIALSMVDWVMLVAPMAIFFNAAQVIFRVLEFRRIFFFLLVITAIRRNEGFGYCALAGVFILIPTLSSPMSAFQYIFITALLAMAAEWRPWATTFREQVVAGRRLRTMLAAAAVLCLMAVVWNGAIKHTWRAKVQGGEVGAGALTAAADFVGTARDRIELISWDLANRLLFQRLSSSVGFFSLVLDRVPDLIPHEGGTLMMRTVQHVTTPRMLFPDKAIVDSASWLVRLYAGQSAAGSESGTSIGLTYMAEFYIDFGVGGMMVGLFGVGVVVGLIYCGLRWMAPSYEIFRAATVALFPLHFAGYESELVKEFGGMLQAFLVYSAIFWGLGGTIHRRLLEVPRRRSFRTAVPAVALTTGTLPDAGPAPR